MVRARSVALALALAALTLARALTAQAPAGDSTIRRPRFDATAVRPGQFVYQMTLERDAGTTVVGTRTVSVSLTNYAGSPAWLMVETKQLDGGLDTDSLFADLLALRPLHWNDRIGGARLAAEFRGDTAFGATSGPPGQRSIIAMVPSGTFLNSAMLETVLRALPLTQSWEDSATTFTGSLGSNTTLPTRLSVIGEDRVQLPAGTFDCWVVAVHAGDTARGLYWVTKRDPIVVRSALDVPSLGGAQLVSGLVRIGR